MVEVERGVYKRVGFSLWATLSTYEYLRREGLLKLPVPEGASSADGRVGYFLLAEAGFPYLAYALFSLSDPRDKAELPSWSPRTIFEHIENAKARRLAPLLQPRLQQHSTTTWKGKPSPISRRPRNRSSRAAKLKELNERPSSNPSCRSYP